MKQEYFESYEKLYEDFVERLRPFYRRTFPYVEFEFGLTIMKAIDNADKRKKLRPDAKYFLAVNFYHLIVLPLIEGSKRGGQVSDIMFNQMQEDIRDDIYTIVSEAKGKNDSGQISGHQIMGTIDRIWGSLKTTKFEIWG
jgi:hypothetical protein